MGPGAGEVVEVPEERLGRGQALRRFEAKRVGVGKLQQQRRQVLVAAASRPNSAACLIALIVSPPPFAKAMILAFEACACSRKDEKSAVLSGWRTAPTTLPPPATTIAVASRSRACPNA